MQRSSVLTFFYYSGINRLYNYFIKHLQCIEYKKIKKKQTCITEVE
jgi:hypothetical protein